MKQYTHAWLALMACKRLYDKRDSLNGKNKKAADALLRFLKQNNDGVVQGAWFPDSVIHDNSTGHIWQLRRPASNESGDSREHTLPTTSQIMNLVEGRNHNEAVILEKGALPDRCQALGYQTRDQLKIKRKVAYGQKNAGAAVIASNNEIALGLFMLAHYVCDAHMPMHCDARKFRDSIHGDVEEYWEEEITQYYSLLTDPAQEKKRFELDSRGLPKIQQGKDISDSYLSVVLNAIENRKFHVSFGTNNSNVWDYVVDVCFFSYLLSSELLPYSISKPASLSKREFKQKYRQGWLDATPIILSDAVDALARIWLYVWREYEEMER